MQKKKIKKKIQLTNTNYNVETKKKINKLY